MGVTAVGAIAATENNRPIKPEMEKNSIEKDQAIIASDNSLSTLPNT